MSEINFNKLAYRNTPSVYKKTNFRVWVDVLISQVKWLYNSVFKPYEEATLYNLSFTGQIIYLEQFLNDKYDSSSRRIYINNVADVDREYIYNKIEQKPKRYVYNKWNSVTAYVAGQYSVEGDTVYICLQNSTNNQPSISPTYWAAHAEKTYFKNHAQYATTYDFIVMVPSFISFNDSEMKAYINLYKIAGKRYTIQTF